MRKLLTIIAALIMCNAYGETVIWYTNADNISANSCTAGGNITKPANPTKNGYRFMGWKEDVNDFAAINGTTYTHSSINSVSGTWTTTFSYGTVSGQSACGQATSGATTGGANEVFLNSPTDFLWATDVTTSNGSKNCWCKATSATINGVSVSLPTKWWWQASLYSPSSCQNACSMNCGSNSYGLGKDGANTLRKFVFTGSLN